MTTLSMKLVLPLIVNAAVTGPAVPITRGGTYSFSCLGTFSTATVALQILGPDGATYIAIPNASFTAAGVMSVDLPAGSTVKAVVTGGPPTGIYASLSLIR